MSEWQPIETCPGNIYVLLGFFYPETNNEKYTESEDADCYIQLGKLSYGNPLVVCGAPANQSARIYLDVSPTHWMPLPTPPEK